MKKQRSVILVTFIAFIMFMTVSVITEASTVNILKGSFDQKVNVTQRLMDQFNNGSISEEKYVEQVKSALSGIEDDSNFEKFQLQESRSRAYNYKTDTLVFGRNSRELALVSKHPISSAKAKKLAGIATSESEKKYREYTRWQGNGDAFRHAYWSALMTRDISTDYAHKAGYAHENRETGTYNKANLDDKMDIKNNHLGRIYGAANKKLSDSKMSSNIAKKVSNGDMVRIRTYSSKRTNEMVAGVYTTKYNKFIKTTSGGLK